MMSSKKVSVKWETPEVQESKISKKDTKTQKETVSERIYSETFEDASNLYSDTFLTESCSSSLDGGSLRHLNQSPGGVFKLITEKDPQVPTVISEPIQTVVELDSESNFSGTAIESDFQDTLINATKDISDALPTDSYSDTFESAGKTRTELEKFTESTTESQKTYSATGTQSSRSLRDSVESSDSELDRSFIAPDYDGKSLLCEEEGDTDQEVYSDTFEPTELTYMSHAERMPEEQFLDRQERQACQNFIDNIIGNIKDKEFVKVRGLRVMSPEPLYESEDEYLKHYCRKKTRQLRKRKDFSATENSVTEGENNDSKVESRHLSAELLSDYGLQDTVMERAKLTNILSAMKKAARSKFHEVKNCPQCRELKTRLETEEAERMFTDSHAKMLKSKMMDEHIENHLLKMNSISMIAELARGLPRCSEKPEKIMDQLLEPLLGKNVTR